MGGISAERYLSLRSGENIIKSLQTNSKYELFIINWRAPRHWAIYDISRTCIFQSTSFQGLLDHASIDCLYNAFCGEQEADGHIAALLELSGIPFVGNSLFTSVIGMNKCLSKLLFKSYQLPVLPDRLVISREEIQADDFRDLSPPPYILKPVSSGSSIGIMKANSERELKLILSEADGQLFPYMVEPFISGREFSITVITNTDNQSICMPVSELLYTGDFFDAQCKEKGDYRVEPANIPEDLRNTLNDMAIQVHEIIKASVQSRTDFIVDSEGIIWILEVNTHPGLGESSILPNQLRELQIPFADYIQGLVDQAVNI